MIINISTYKERCRKFAEESVDSSQKVWSRGRITRARLVEDIYTGKLGEYAAFLHISKFEVGLSEPDIQVYSARKKSWIADLTSRYHDFHCKTQSLSSATKYGVSWIFQHEPGKRVDPILKDPGPRDSLVLMSMIDGETVEVRIVLPVSMAIENKLFEPPKCSFFLGNKLAIYWDSIKKLEDK